MLMQSDPIPKRNENKNKLIITNTQLEKNKKKKCKVKKKNKIEKKTTHRNYTKWFHYDKKTRYIVDTNSNTI